MAIQVNLDNRIFLIPEVDDPCDFWTSYFGKLKSEFQDLKKFLKMPLKEKKNISQKFLGQIMKLKMDQY